MGASRDTDTSRDTDGGRALPLPPLVLLTAVIAFLLMPLSLPLWRLVPQLWYLQFPWRLLAILAPVAALAVAAALAAVCDRIAARPATAAAQLAAQPSSQPAAYSAALSPAQPALQPTAHSATRDWATLLLPVLMLPALVLPAWTHFRQVCDQPDTPRAQLEAFTAHAGVDPTDEYTPTPDDNDALHPDTPPYWLAPNATCSTAEPSAAAPPGPALTSDASPAPTPAPSPEAGPAPAQLPLMLNRPACLVLNLRDYPAWTVQRDGQPDPDRIHRDDGLLALPLPAGHSTLALRYRRTADHTAGDALSLLAAAATLPLLRRRRAHAAH